MNDKKTIFLSLFDGDSERIILRTDAFKTIRESGHRIVLLVRGEERIARLKRDFGSENVVVELLPEAASRLETLWYYVSWNTVPSRAVSVRRYREYWVSRQYALYALAFLAWFFGHLRIWRTFLRWFYLATGEDYASELFEKYQPDLLFATNMFSPEDSRLLRMARRRGVPSITLAKSWDVLTTKAFTRVIADKMIVYNDFNRQEAIEFGDYKPEQLIVTGFPQFDIYTHGEIFKTREEFCVAIGLEPERRIVLYGLPGDWKSPDTRAILSELGRRIDANGFVKPMQVLARFHPKYNDSSAGLDASHVVFDRPGIQLGAGNEFGIDAGTGTSKWAFRDEDIIHLANSIYHSDVVISVDSTLTLDAAALDKPSVLIAYDGDRKLPYKRSIAFIYERNHFRNVVDTGAAPLVHSHDELVHELNAFMSDTTYRAEARAELKRRLLHKTDGESGKRMGEAVLGML